MRHSSPIRWRNNPVCLHGRIQSYLLVLAIGSTLSSGGRTTPAMLMLKKLVDILGTVTLIAVLPVTWAPNSLHSKVESWVAVTPIMTVFLCSVERRFSAPAAFVIAAARSLGQVWPQATGEAGAQRTGRRRARQQPD